MPKICFKLYTVDCKANAYYSNNHNTITKKSKNENGPDIGFV